MHRFHRRADRESEEVSTIVQHPHPVAIDNRSHANVVCASRIGLSALSTAPVDASIAYTAASRTPGVPPVTAKLLGLYPPRWLSKAVDVAREFDHDTSIAVGVDGEGLHVRLILRACRLENVKIRQHGRAVAAANTRHSASTQGACRKSAESSGAINGLRCGISNGTRVDRRGRSRRNAPARKIDVADEDTRRGTTRVDCQRGRRERRDAGERRSVRVRLGCWCRRNRLTYYFSLIVS